MDVMGGGKVNLKVDKFNELIKAKNLSVKDIAWHINVSRQTVDNWARGDSNPRRKFIFPICSLLDVNENELFEAVEKFEQASLMTRIRADLIPVFKRWCKAHGRTMSSVNSELIEALVYNFDG